VVALVIERHFSENLKTILPRGPKHDVRRRLQPMQVELEQRIIIKFLTKENMDAHEILAKLHTHFEDKASAL
jgi:hypothetical protein